MQSLFYSLHSVLYCGGPSNIFASHAVLTLIFFCTEKSLCNKQISRRDTLHFGGSLDRTLHKLDLTA